MNPGETTPPSPLDKPLAELTEEDIAQLTREDCRRFLKAKGMRRPSWNKSQAIQQVISLKALLEGRPGCDDCPAGGGILQKLLTSSPSEPLSPPQDSPPPAPKEGGSGSQPLAKEPSPYRRRDPIPPPYSAGNPTCQTPIAGADLPHPPEKRCPSPRLTAEVPVGQMTIFYDGMVNVYDGVSADQARSIMELAASPVCFDDPTGAFSPARPPAFRFPPGLPRPAPVPTAPSFVGTFPISPAGTMIHRVADGSDDRRVPRETEPVVGIDGSAYDLTSIFGRRNLWRCYSSRLCPLNLGTLIEHVGKSTMIMFITQLICSPALDFDIFDEIVSFCFVSYLYLYIYAMATIASAINKILRCQHYPDSVHQGYKSKNVKSACQLIIAVYAIRGHQGLVNAVS
ncbi:protein TIFY 4B isoform X1 [Musa acuminata AAA Group]|uniref:protein TIFY 4B isoform X1 n=1 Tax=Musa acuminata AAA Group TaxID=214697 RepID=UPI0008A09EC6|nr:PREDICTED: protein TIFY 4B isoform X1 [Musa acuminata subsp. malaccensis]XP_018677887.1 PREDICTED: protein TIFY 4B isoform X1 [Musa acuminata subsp. malaccensis]XP_018677888.1 PREDICTED: protein TIFY 4B isoform X1 [Musa acuminata subsp. malaccensis]XP_018677889.1 PREDICTED: protein TIFY 4B isoform X1 [Musa acuminata subsp. malaccensis]XP_018677890.1 PREDICTED: protein TIFY 4B isoform X1 [Musa acuminata subsp. malaccensis]XP_018677891.1 PREDICTED: protein TIFY 4B isoform X1 [Musa acuminata s